MIGVDFIFHAQGPATGPTDGRYEYRVWPAPDHPAVSHLQRAWPLAAADRRSDIYLLGRRLDRFIVKLRGGQRLEIKRRLRDLGDIQHWTMPVSTAFPLGAGHRAALIEALGLSDVLDAEKALSPAHLLSALGAQAPGIISQTTRKSRLLFESEGCRAEICRVVVGGWTGLTVAVEASELSMMTTGIEDLRLGALPNRSYGDMLGSLLGLQPTQPLQLLHTQILERRQS